MESFRVLDANLDILDRQGVSAQRATANAWLPVMQKILDRSEAEGAQVSALAINEADAILLSTLEARDMLVMVAAVAALASVALFLPCISRSRVPWSGCRNGYFWRARASPSLRVSRW